MRIEHKLSPAAVQSFKAAIEQLNALRVEYLQALGLAKEAETKSQTLQQSLGQQLGLIQQTEGLPTPIQPYHLSEDCTKLVGEIADPPQKSDPPAADPPAAIEPARIAAAPVEARVNGAGIDHA